MIEALSDELERLAVELRAACAAEIDGRTVGHFNDRPWLRAAFLEVPREHFVPDRVWWPTPRADGLHHVIDRHERPRAWLKGVYRPRASLITQVADGAVRPEDGPTDAPFTSAVSCSAVVVDMLHHLDPGPSDTALEIGTGSGYSTALLAQRVRPENLVTIEIDEQLADRARRSLADFRLRPAVVTGDGERGCPDRGPYTRIISTAAVRQIPRAWLDQAAPGAVIVTPLHGPFGHDALLRLVADGQGGGAGRLVTGVAFMKMRGQRAERPFTDLGWPTVEGPWPAYSEACYQVTVRDGRQRIRIC
ncbi:Protein-L-isoaspartate O-methyltransferase [Streptomyces hundungensis]|uniref:Protein-L-isoaspartate O-methyltransferase n=1 Tax=Streptomyces hundungensis TaxID=1077946 RepID=A0A387HBS4_9ACTN|nr:methyltransferase domain-containing protein [Streptomyces hundungensis]AYG78217.1 Protein-L-isoaspartate O-methyltransferase [Streptomyces hundungensis]